ncbi:transcriptional regulator [Calorimonas adulescens]|uniref:Transcriptional regulator n=1 Tax=Calorimonas adulescens TaxID=2606906 RepID=A0A5D8QD93_9THEO|nr:transcriptional regulator [Calorimonas adulescens]TZE82620.1 transcriptional regulator [Calorimonas adulescens]
MLIKILKKLAGGGIYSNRLMTTELGVDKRLVEQMINQLQQPEYIERDSIGNCSSHCSCCTSKKRCCSNNDFIDLNIWRITDKGEKAMSQ